MSKAVSFCYLFDNGNEHKKIHHTNKIEHILSDYFQITTSNNTHTSHTHTWDYGISFHSPKTLKWNILENDIIQWQKKKKQKPEEVWFTRKNDDTQKRTKI